MALDLAVWPRVFAGVPFPYWPAAVRAMAVDAERRRQRADYDTGSITEYEAYCLLALAEYFAVKVVIEVGTFIGMSTVALSRAKPVQAVYTCDASNDCLPSDEVIHTYPKTSSTDMLRDLVARGICADLCFFDGTLVSADLDLLKCVTRLNTVYAFHDYNYGPKIRKGGTLETMPRKGIGNVRALQSRLIGYVLIPPQPETTLALLVPEALL